MKKVLSLLLVLTLVLCLVSCANVQKARVDKNNPKAYEGIWKSKHMSFRFLGDGTGFYDYEKELYTKDHKKTWQTYGGELELHYVVDNEVVTVTVKYFWDEYVSVLELNDDGTVLSLIQNGLDKWYCGETEFVKGKIDYLK